MKVRNRRTNFLDKIETYIYVTIFAVLTWLFAYSKALVRSETTVEVQLVPQVDGIAITPKDPFTASLRIEVSNTQRGVLDALTQETLAIPVTLDDSGSMLLAPALTEHIFQDAGIVVQSAEPVTVEVEIENLVDVTLPIRLDIGEARLSSNLKLTPAEIMVTLPESQAVDIENLEATARLRSGDLVNVLPNIETTRSIAVTIPQALTGAWTSVTPSTTDVTFTLVELTKTATLPTVRVLALYAPMVTSEYDIQLIDDNQFLRDIEITGPADLIDRITKRPIDEQTINVYAYFAPSRQDIESGKTSFKVSMELPLGVTTTQPLPEVQVTVERRPDANGG